MNPGENCGIKNNPRICGNEAKVCLLKSVARCSTRKKRKKKSSLEQEENVQEFTYRFKAVLIIMFSATYHR